MSKEKRDAAGDRWKDPNKKERRQLELKSLNGIIERYTEECDRQLNEVLRLKEELAFSVAMGMAKDKLAEGLQEMLNATRTVTTARAEIRRLTVDHQGKEGCNE